MNNLFNTQLFEKYLSNIQITEEQINHLKLWNRKLENNELISETSNYHYFEKVFLNVLFGYDSFTDILTDDKEKTGSGKSEFKLKINDKVFMIIELKGSKIKLDKTRNNKNETPVDQVFRYAKKNEAVPWLLVSNYNEFRLYNYHKGDGKYISWNMKELVSDINKLKEFIFVLCKKSFEEEIIDKLINKTITIQEKFNDEFYKLYSETRLMIIHDLEENSENIDRIKSIHYAQLILDRVLFICFAEDKKLLPEQILETTILNPLENGNVRKHRIFDRLRELFEDVHEGNQIKNIPGYNGGLFKERLYFLDIQDTIENPTEYYKDCYNNWKFESQKNKTEELLGDYKDTINPIYKNFLTMAIFDFDSDIDVNILGHIFESSIGDIEKLKKDNRETRHKFGIHYTPVTITEYICNNTIIPYLSKSGKVNQIPELLSEYNYDVDILDEKLKNIKILDPACGSGAFLNKAVDVLLEIHEAVWHQKYYKKETLDKFFDYESERREIILNNIYGVDLNEESTEITKLGLFLKICKKDKKLPSLDENIKCGNSVIDDPDYAGEKAFKWEEEFKNILDNGGFDCIIGNPPYVRQELIKEDKPYYKKHYETYSGLTDLYSYFFEKGLKILKNNGFFGYICSNSWTKASYGKQQRKIILNNSIIKYVDYTGQKIFEDAEVDVSTIIIQKSKPEINHEIIINNSDKLTQSDEQLLSEDHFIFNPKITTLIKKIYRNPTFKEISEIIIRAGPKTGKNNVFIINKSLKDKLINEDKKNSEVIKPMLRGKNINKWYANFNEEYLIFTRGDFDLKNYPYIEKYLSQYKSELMPKKVNAPKNAPGRKTGSYEWYQLQDQAAYYKDFLKPKILWNEIAYQINGVLDNKKYYLNNKCYFIISEKYNIKYILAVFNSNISNFLIKQLANSLKNGYNIGKNFVEQIPIVLPLEENETIFDHDINDVQNNSIKLNKEIKGFLKWLQGEYNIDKLSQKLEKYYELTFDEFLEEVRKKKVNTKKRAIRENLEDEFNNSLKIIKQLQSEIQKLEDKINQKVYEIYDLTDEEIKIIENNI